ncbi:MAG: glycoside hydrolase family 3 N-terminal domain-containing protein [Pirellulales bacterium]
MTELQPFDLGSLTLRERLAQLMVIRIGSDIPPVRTADEDAERVKRLLAECPVGGLLLFNGRHATTPAVLAGLQATSRVPLLVMADVERGYGQQLRPWPLMPHAMAFERLGRGAAEAVREFGELTAVSARRAGVHVINAPVADVHSDPANPIIATRAFSSDPARAGNLAAAFVAGCAAGGGLAVAKHFPGHGDTREDSHHSLPAVLASADVLQLRELVPFRATMAAGVPLIMTAHVRYPALDPSGAPATLSAAMLEGLLRCDLGFEGAVVSDSLLMAGVRGLAASEGELCLRGLLAGVDLLLDVEHPAAAVAVLEAAVRAGDLPLARVDEAAARMLGLKQRVFAPACGSESRFASCDEPALRSATQALADRVAAAAVEVHDPRGLLPFDSSRSLVAVLVNPYRSHIDAQIPPLAASLQQSFSHCEFVEMRGNESAEAWRSLTHRCLAAEQVLVAVVVKPAAWHRFGLATEVDAWLRDLATQRLVTLASLGCGLSGDHPAAARITALSDVPASQEAVARCVRVRAHS